MRFIDADARRMTSNRLKLNLTKTEFVWCCTTRRLHLIDNFSITVSYGTVNTVTSVRNLDAFPDQALSLRWPCKPSGQTVILYPLRRIKLIRKEHLTSAAIQLVSSFIVSTVDYCNNLLWGAPAHLTNHIQPVFNMSAKLIMGVDDSIVFSILYVTGCTGCRFDRGLRSTALCNQLTLPDRACSRRPSTPVTLFSPWHVIHWSSQNRRQNLVNHLSLSLDRLSGTFCRMT